MSPIYFMYCSNPTPGVSVKALITAHQIMFSSQPIALLRLFTSTVLTGLLVFLSLPGMAQTTVFEESFSFTPIDWNSKGINLEGLRPDGNTVQADVRRADNSQVYGYGSNRSATFPCLLRYRRSSPLIHLRKDFFQNENGHPKPSSLYPAGPFLGEILTEIYQPSNLSYQPLSFGPKIEPVPSPSKRKIRPDFFSKSFV